MTMNTPLPGAWTLWFYHRDRTVKFYNYLAGTHEVIDFSTPGSFWQVFSHLAPITTLSLWSEYQIFRKNIKPMWEDPLNAKGGRWTLRLKRYKAPKLGDANYDYQQKLVLYVQDQAPFMWEQLLLSVVSGSFSNGRVFDDLEVLGLVISVRREEFVISLWNKTATDPVVINALRDAILEVCQATESEVNLEYSPHAESLTKVAEKSKTVRGGFNLHNNHQGHGGHHPGHSGYNTGHNGTSHGGHRKEFRKKWHHDAI